MTRSELPETLAALREGMQEGLHVGAQLYVSRQGREVASVAVGDARPGVAMTTDTLMPWMSCSKPVAAVALAQLRDRGLLTFDDPVATHLPEFAAQGKDAITIRHLLTHTAGLRAVPPGWDTPPWERIVAAVCAAKPEPGWAPGARAGYHLGSSWFMLGEIVRRLGARSYADYVRDEIFLPLGMRDAWIGMPAEQYAAYGDLIGLMHDTSRSPATPHDAGIDQASATLGAPGAGGRGPMRELARFYDMLRNGDERVLSRESVRELTSRQRVGMFDETFRHAIDWGLGFIVNSNRYGADTVPYGFGQHASEETFGHGGAQSSTSFADRKHNLIVALVWNGTPGEEKHQQRLRETLTALYQDLQLA